MFDTLSIEEPTVIVIQKQVKAPNIEFKGSAQSCIGTCLVVYLTCD